MDDEAVAHVSHGRSVLLATLLGGGIALASVVLGTASPASASEQPPPSLLGTLSSVVSEVTTPVSELLDTTITGVTGAVPAVTGGVTTAVPAPVSQVAEPVLTPVTELVGAVVGIVPDAPVGMTVTPVTELIDPIVEALPVVGELLGPTPTATLTTPVIGLVDDTVGTLLHSTSELVVALPGGLLPEELLSDELLPPAASLVGEVTGSGATIGGDRAFAGEHRGSPDTSARAAGASDHAPTSTPEHPVKGIPLFAPGSSGSALSGSAGATGAAGIDSATSFFSVQMAQTTRALQSDDALPGSPTFDLGSTPD